MAQKPTYQNKFNERRNKFMNKELQRTKILVALDVEQIGIMTGQVFRVIHKVSIHILQVEDNHTTTFHHIPPFICIEGLNKILTIHSFCCFTHWRCSFLLLFIIIVFE